MTFSFLGRVVNVGAASNGSLFVYNILRGIHGILPIVTEAIFRYNVTSIYDKIIVNCRRSW